MYVEVLKNLAKKLFGDKVSHNKAGGKYSQLSLYDIRHNASCYWLKRYSTHRALMYRMGWTSEKWIKYYSEFLGQNDEISDEEAPAEGEEDEEEGDEEPLDIDDEVESPTEAPADEDKVEESLELDARLALEESIVDRLIHEMENCDSDTYMEESEFSDIFDDDDE